MIITPRRTVLKMIWIVLAILLIFHPISVNAKQSVQILFEKALDASKAGEMTQALQLWNDFLELEPNNPAALSNRGNVRLAIGDFQGSIADQTMAIRILPEETDPYINRGIAEEALELWEAAGEDYQLILDRDPNDADALFNMGNVQGSQGNWDFAAALYKRASIARPNFSMARARNALANYQIGQFDDTESELRSLIRRYPMLADSRAALTALLWSKGQIGEAESNWVAAIGLDGRYSNLEWLLKVKRWPPKPAEDLMAFLSLETR